ncbi:MAG: type I restriction endonuclease subunit R [Muribaculaceae bacterium]|nr:type I restriction endonuclease subunit R [Muribaculaceae bacterium]
MSHEYSENILVQESAGNLLRDELGWDVVFAYNQEALGQNGTLGRSSYKEVVLTRYLEKALLRLNPWLTDKQLSEALMKFMAYSATNSIMQINEEKFKMIRDGIEVTDSRPGHENNTITARLIDFDNPDNNHFLAVKEMKIHGSLYRRRTDIVGFVNGIPLLFVELKGVDVDVENAYNNNYKDYLDTIPQLFHYNAFLMLSNGYEAKIGTLDSKYEFFHEWKRLKEEDAGSVELDTMLRGVCDKRTFLDLLENFIIYDHSEGRTTKILSRNHQYLGVNRAIEAYRDRKFKDGKLGVFWHTQGSGKSYSMVFFARKINRKFEGSPTFVVLTDREELNTQISELFVNCGLIGGEAKNYIASSGQNLIDRLKDNPSYIFTLIHKFNKPNATPYIPEHDIVLMSDEAHRTQNGTYAENMMHLLPTAHRIGFTGTPIFKDDNITTRTFGDYISIYDFKRAVDDHATVPLFYENRGEKLKELQSDAINTKILAAIQDADLDPSQEEKVEREFSKEIHLLLSEKRLRMIARDFVQHYTDLWTSGKAMMVCLSRIACVMMYDYVQEYWQEAIANLEHEISKNTNQQEVLELNRKLKWMRETEMAVVISQEQNEIAYFQKWGKNIKPHREKMETRELDKEYKDRENPLRIVFVCAMWLTGFDVKSLSCLYIDKPLKAHTLMQTIARANRVCDGKPNGLIIDYIGIVKSLRKALADYTTSGGEGSGGEDVTVDKNELIRHLLEAITGAKAFLIQQGFDLESLVNATDFTKMALLKDAANLMCSTSEVRKTYCTYGGTIKRLMKFITHDDITDSKILADKNAIIAIYAQLQTKRKSADITDLSVAIHNIISDEVGTKPDGNLKGSRQFDISKIDFDLLRKEFSKMKHQNLVLKDIDELIKQRIDAMLRNNPNRINFYEEYQRIIQEYNAEQDRASIEKTFMALIDLSKSLDQEEKRFVLEGFTDDEQLTIYDLLFKEDISKSDIDKLKKVSVDLLVMVKNRIASLHNWREKATTTAIIGQLIHDTLYQDLPESYDINEIEPYSKKLYEYIYERYPFVAA